MQTLHAILVEWFYVETVVEVVGVKIALPRLRKEWVNLTGPLVPSGH